MFAAREAWRAGLWAPKHWAGNIAAGMIVGVVALPLAMAFAIASGVKPEQGLYTAIVAGVVVSLFGGSRVQIAGPTGAFIVILSGIVAEHGVAGLQLATLMAGLMLCAFGLARLGGVIRYIPLPVILGFTAGIGIIIWVGQWQAFLGLPAVRGHFFHEKFWFLIQHLTQLDPVATAFGVGSLALVLLPRRVRILQRIPGPLLALVVATILQGIFQFPQLATIGSTFGDLPRGLPLPHWPGGGLDRIVPLIGPAFTIALLGAIESLLSAVVADSMAGTRHDSNAELFGQGLANVISPLFGGIAATGAIARTATNIRSGGYAPLAGVVHALVLALVLLAFAPLARNIPLATLAAILFVVAWNMSEAHRVVRLIRHAPRADAVILCLTLLLTVFADLVVAVNIGIVLSVLRFLHRMASSVVVTPVAIPESGPGKQHAGIRVLRVRGPLFFAAVETLREAFRTADAPTLILSLDQVPFADATALQALDDEIVAAHARGMRVILCGAEAPIRAKLSRMGTLSRLGADDFQQDLLKALAAAETTGH
ncbi:MAG: SulP family inorganic anion transporter [Castellaniella sp.]|uniref:SulP family inorganic anion transporter n=1 Tax=Castellaniella sp. TaxID=1955812 RepID=UPI002A372410|nr:SulP family inorganic anion transporter [Castellaniella sp.]MDY0310239.1 SulP family inorganic anion transporter [Castellaniella sp.]